ncbi:MAG: hypothetical protein E7477_08175 [Ruminococcaceae bacterium]|nr:hypothetical protein [Oscillospiraceae bacterium]
MRKDKSTYIQNILLPCVLFSIITGVVTGTLIFLFKASASFLISKSEMIYEFARENPMMIPLLIIGMAVVGLLSAILLKYVPDARGGGIPTAIAILRGLITFSWVKSIVFVFVSAMLTYFGGVPLGNEGPSVQMGTAAGKGIVSLFAKKHMAWDRYIMTGGACAGFAAATGSPITGLLFAFEEAHRRVSPMIFMVAAMSTFAGVSTAQLLCHLTNTSFSLFHFSINAVMPLKYIWTAIIIGLIAGLTAAGFTYLYNAIRHFVKTTLKRIPFTVKIVSIFVISAIIGLISAESIGSGHHLIDHLIEGHGVTAMLIVIFIVRAFLLLLANNSDITGGLFVPTLAFGAIIGALSGKVLVYFGLLPEEYYSITVIMGIAAYLSSSSRTPLIALAFATEALYGMSNILPIGIAITVSFLVIETMGIPAFTDTVVENKAESFNHGKNAYIVEAHMTVKPESFICGKEVRDVIFPPTCVILDIQKDRSLHIPTTSLSEGDIVHLHFQSFDIGATTEQLEAIFGTQTNDINSQITFSKKNQHVPEIT